MSITCDPEARCVGGAAVSIIDFPLSNFPQEKRPTRILKDALKTLINAYPLPLSKCSSGCPGECALEDDP